MAQQQHAAGDSPILDASLSPHILDFLGPSLMLRSTCRAFNGAIERHDAPEKHRTVAQEATSSISLLRWAIGNGMHPNMAHKSCISRGDLDGLLLLRNHYDLPLHLDHAYCAARGGHVRMLQWLLEQRCASRHDADVCRFAAEGGHLEALQWLRQTGSTWNGFTCSAAAEQGHLEVLQWAHANGCRWSNTVCSGAAAGGRLDTNGCPWDERTCSAAAKQGHLQVLQWARVNGCPCSTEMCSIAARAGRIEVLQWARANGYAWYERTCASAAERGDLQMLQWARAQGCPWDERTCDAAEERKHLELWQWARANGCPCDDFSAFLFAEEMAATRANRDAPAMFDMWGHVTGLPLPRAGGDVQNLFNLGEHADSGSEDGASEFMW